MKNCGIRTYESLLEKVHKFLSADKENTDGFNGQHLDRPIQGLIHNSRAQKACMALGIQTIGQFLSTPKEVFLNVDGFGERSYWDIAQRLRVLITHQEPNLYIWPTNLLEFRLDDLGLKAELQQSLCGIGIECLRDLLVLPREFLEGQPNIGSDGIDSIHDKLQLLVRVGIDQTAKVPDQISTTGAESIILSLTSVLDDDQKQLFSKRIGWLTCQQSISTLASEFRVSVEQLRAMESDIRHALKDKAPGLIAKIHDEAVAECRAFEGLIHSNHLAQGSILYRIAKRNSDPELPLRLVRFIYPNEFYLYGNLLTTLSPNLYREFRRELRLSCISTELPKKISDVEKRLQRIINPIPRGLMLHLLKHRHRLAIYIDPDEGEVIERTRSTSADRLYSILKEKEKPISLDDLLFHYRDRFQKGRMDQLCVHLYHDNRFIEVDKNLWGLRENFLDELEMASAEASRIANLIQNSTERFNLTTFSEENGISKRSLYMILDCMVNNHTLRNLGRSEFCSRSNKLSAVLTRVLQEFRKAMGEVVLSRFLRNQPTQQTKLVQRILTENRMFVEPNPDRIDLLSNYPFNEERMHRLLDVVDDCLRQNHGYGHISTVAAALQKTDLGGEWLSEHLLFDLLRRNGAFELLPGRLVAHANLGLTGWIQQRAREAIRLAGIPLTPENVISEMPDLVEFKEILADLLETDPMVQCQDGIHYGVI